MIRLIKNRKWYYRLRLALYRHTRQVVVFVIGDITCHLITAVYCILSARTGQYSAISLEIAIEVGEIYVMAGNKGQD